MMMLIGSILALVPVHAAYQPYQLFVKEPAEGEKDVTGRMEGGGTCVLRRGHYDYKRYDRRCYYGVCIKDYAGADRHVTVSRKIWGARLANVPHGELPNSASQDSARGRDDSRSRDHHYNSDSEHDDQKQDQQDGPTVLDHTKESHRELFMELLTEWTQECAREEEARTPNNFQWVSISHSMAAKEAFRNGEYQLTWVYKVIGKNGRETTIRTRRGNWRLLLASKPGWGYVSCATLAGQPHRIDRDALVEEVTYFTDAQKDKFAQWCAAKKENYDVREYYVQAP